ncbi:phage tail tape measure protein [Paenibacillus sp. ACRRX]|uniref:phage tail tape measure protein n=1 Tax=Paenibacillus sp. ACRRX TaxID=2918206 RepID=UPI001EF69D52|nr:phage tail tape measure protein [Paenibacillus sp. ACRRX]MCG7406385.1 phage tail tape measure protein [Paenibacillus sp. ACRRX]
MVSARIHENALQENRRREQEYLRSREELAAKLAELNNRIGSDDHYARHIESLNAKLRNTSSAGNYQQAISNVEQEMRRLAVTADNPALNTTFKQFLSGKAEHVKQFAQSLSFLQAPLLAISATVMEVDSKMTQLKKVMNEDTNFNRMLSESIALSKQLGMSISSVVEQSAQIAGSGYEGPQVMALTQSVGLAQNVTNLSADQAIDTITTAMNAFNIQAGQSIKIVDQLNAVDNEYAISAQNLSASLGSAGEQARQYGVSIQELLGHTTAIHDVTRESGDSIGEGLKTIYSQITTLGSSSTLLQQVGIQVIDSTNGTMKSASAILGELAQKWNTLSNSTKQNLGVTIAGKEQFKQFSALMSNYQVAIDASGHAYRSHGSAMGENAQYMDSLQARTERLRTAWQELALKVGEAFVTDSLVVLVNILTGLGSGLVWLTNTFGTLPVLIVGVTSAIGILYVMFRQAIASNAIMIAGLFGIAPATTAATAGVTGLSGALRTLGLSIKSLLASTGVGLALVLVGTLASSLMDKFGGAKDSTEQFKNSMDEVNKTISDTTHLKQLSEEYQKLSEVQGKTSQDKLRISAIESELNAQYGISIDSVSNQANAYDLNSQAIKQKLTLMEEEIRLQRESAMLEYESNKSSIDKDIANKRDKKESARLEYEDAAKKHAEFIRKRDNKEIISNENNYFSNNLFSSVKFDPNKQTAQAGIARLGEQLASEVKQANEKMITANKEFGDSVVIAETGKSAELQAFIDGYAAKGEKVTESTRLLTGALAQVAAVNNVNISDSDFRSIFDVFQQQNITSIEEAISVFEKIPATLNLNEDSIRGFRNEITKINFSNFNKGTNHVSDSLLSLEDRTSSFNDKIKDNVSDIRKLNGVLSDMASGQSMSSDAMYDLIIQYPELASNIYKTADGWKIEQHAISDLSKEKSKKVKDDIKNEKAASLITLNNIRSRLEMYGIEIQAINNVKDAKNLMDEVTGKLLFEDHVLNSNAVNSLPPEYSEKIKAAALNNKNTLLENQKGIRENIAYMNALGAIESTINEGSPSSKPSGSSNSGSTSANEAKFESKLKLDQNEEDIKNHTASLEANNQAIETAIAKGQNYEKLLNARINIHHRLIDSLKKLHTSQVQEQASLKKTLTDKGLLSKGQVVDNVADKLNKLAKSSNPEAMEKLEQQVQQYVDLTDKINNTKSQLQQASMNLADTLNKGLEQIKSSSERKIAKSQYKISLLGEINTSAEKKLLAAYSAEIVSELALQQKKINDELYKAQRIINNPKASAEARSANEIYAQTLRSAKQNVESELVSKAEESGKQQADALLNGYQKQLSELEYKKSLLGTIDTDEEKKQAAKITTDIKTTLINEQKKIEDEIKLVQQNLKKKGASLLDTHQRQAKLESLQEEQKNVNKKLVDMNDEELKIRNDNANAIIDNYKKMLDKHKEMQIKAKDEEIRLEKEKHDKKIKLLDDLQKRNEDYINAQLKSFDRSNQTEDYDASLKKMVDERQAVQDRLHLLDLDNSLEAKAKRKTLQEELNAKDDEINKFKQSRERDLRKQGLQDQLDDLKTTLDKEKELENNLHNDKIKGLEKEKTAIEEKHKLLMEKEILFSTLKQQLMSQDKAVFNQGIADMRTEYDKFFEFLKTNSALVGQQMADHLRGQFAQDLSDYGNSNQAGNVPPAIGNQSSTAPVNPSNEDVNTAWNKYLANKQEAEGLIIKDKGKNKVRINELRQENDDYRAAYKFPDLPYSQLRGKAPFTAETGGMTPAWGSGGKYLLAHEKELILNKTDTFNLLKIIDVTRHMMDSIRSFKFPSLATSGNVIENLHVSVQGNFAQKNGDDVFSSIINGLKAKGVEFKRGL